MPRVTIDLNRGTGDFDDNENTIKTASGGHAAGDKVKYGSFVHVLGSSHGDRITGDNQDNTLTGGAGSDRLMGDDGDDMLNGGPGGDTLDGGDGDMDIATYADATEGVTIDLSSVSERDNVITIRNSGGRGDARSDTFHRHRNIRWLPPRRYLHRRTGRSMMSTAVGGTDTPSPMNDPENPWMVTLPTGGWWTHTSSYTGGIHAKMKGDKKDNYAQGDLLT